MLNGHSDHSDRPLLRSVRYLCFRHRFAAGAGLDVTRKGKKTTTCGPIRTNGALAHIRRHNTTRQTAVLPDNITVTATTSSRWISRRLRLSMIFSCFYINIYVKSFYFGGELPSLLCRGLKIHSQLLFIIFCYLAGSETQTNTLVKVCTVTALTHRQHCAASCYCTFFSPVTSGLVVVVFVVVVVVVQLKPSRGSVSRGGFNLLIRRF